MHFLYNGQNGTKSSIEKGLSRAPVRRAGDSLGGSKHLAALIDESARVGVEIFRKKAALGAPRKSSRDPEIYRQHRSGKTGRDSRGADASALLEQPVELRFRGLGFFPNAKRPRVLWAGIAGSAELAVSLARYRSSLAKLGIPAEERAFTPHLTLARFEPPRFPPELRAAIEKDAARDFGELRTSRIPSHRKQAETFRRGVHYAAIVRICGGGLTAHA